MKEVDLSNLFDAAQASSPTTSVRRDDDGNVIRFKPAAGDSFPVQVVDTNVRTTKAGFASWGLWLEVLDGPDKGERFWTNQYLSANAGANGRVFNALMAFGLTEAFIRGGDLKGEAIGSALKGMVADVEIGYDGDWDRHTYTSIQEEVQEATSMDDLME